MAIFKIIIACIATLLSSWLTLTLEIGLFNMPIGLAPICAVIVMGSFILYEQKK